ncbi:hypothetical protein Tco_0533004 [Tanacetum coccineum]
MMPIDHSCDTPPQASVTLGVRLPRDSNFLNGKSYEDSLTKNPTIYVSLIKKFWQTATIKNIDNGETRDNATVNDTQECIVLKLSEEGEGSGHPSEPQPPPSFTAQPTHEEPIPNVRRQVTHNKTQSMAIPNVPLPHGISSPRCQEAMGVPLPRLAKILADAAEENVHTYTRIRRAVSTGSIGISTASRLFSTAKELRQKYFAAQKTKAKRNKPMKQAQQRNYMISYIKHMGSHTLQQLKIYSFDELKELFETTMKNVNTFVPMETEDRGRASELAAGSSQATIIDSAEVRSPKRAAEAELNHDGSKWQKTNEASRSV